jgi:energy-coupling factor transporter ATP-binding protein EcfA2
MSPSVPQIAIFGGEYNAKGKSFRDVGRTFIPPHAIFESFIAPSNVLLMGPRGAGKTTLMKMLTGPALESYGGPRADAYRERIRYTGVFVAGDVAWARQLANLEIDAREGERFAISVFVLHCLAALVEAAAERTRAGDSSQPHRRVQVPDTIQQQIARDVANLWQVGRPVAGLDDLVVALADAALSVSRLRSQLVHLPDSERSTRVANTPLLHLDLIPAALTFIERFNNACGERDGRWALLLDEAELAPPVVLRYLIDCLRGTNELFLFKISFAQNEREDLELGRPLGPREANDFTTLRLTFANKKDARPFSEALFRARLAAAAIEPSDLLGESTVITLDDDDEDGGDADVAAYAPEAPYGELLAELAEIDPSFVTFLVRNKIALEKASQLPEPLRARLRKVLPVAALRLEQRRPQAGSDQSARLRSRRNIALYSGTEAFYAMMEGNPRWLNHVSDQLLAAWSGQGRIPAETQAGVFRRAAREFSGYLAIQPVRGTHLHRDDSPKRLLDRMGNFFRDGYVRGPFDSDPYGSLVVDDEFSETITESLSVLINRGALIEVPSAENAGLTSFRGKRFRLAYLMAPRYTIPLRLDKPIDLSRILSRKAPSDQLTLDELAADDNSDLATGADT